MKLLLKIFLPLIILNTLFGNSYNEVLEIVSQMFGILLIIVCFVILIFFARNKYAPTLIFILIVSKVLSLFTGQSLFYDISYSIVFMLTGAFVFQNYLDIIGKQFSLYFIISGTLIFFQITGWYPKLHLFNIYVLEYYENYGSIYGNEFNFPEVFVNFGDRYSLFDQSQIYLSNIQNRPSGIFHSNAYLGPYMLFSHLFFVTSFIKYRNALLFFLLTFFLLITGSKLVLFGSFIILILNRKFFGALFNKLFLIYMSSFSLYYILFPTVVLTNFTVDAILYSFGVRLIDQLGVLGSFDFLLENLVIGEYANFNNEYQGFSDFWTLVVSLIIIGFFYLIHRKKVSFFFRAKSISSEYSFLLRSTLIWFSLVLFTTPLFGNHLVSFILGLIVSPFLANYKEGTTKRPSNSAM